MYLALVHRPNWKKPKGASVQQRHVRFWRMRNRISITLGEADQLWLEAPVVVRFEDVDLLHAAISALLQRNSLASVHTRWNATPNLRASFTLARFRPRRCPTSRAQRLRLEKRVARVSMMSAASKSAIRTMTSPALVTVPSRPVSPVWYFLGAARSGR